MKPSIVVDHISKKYKIGAGLTSIRELFSISKDNNPTKYRWAVKDVSFDLAPGKALAILGPNGAGKTTILKMLSQVTKPTTGSIQVNGRLSALIELGAGFHMDLTGRENIYLNGAILGMHKQEISERFDEIVDFAGIGDYLDTPVKRYSSGMYARLGFAIAAHIDPEVLLVDEVLAVGDFAFQTKCYARMDALRSKGTSIIFVSHNMEAMRRTCDAGLVLYRGEAVFQGSIHEAIASYSEVIREKARGSKTYIPTEEGLSQRIMSFDAEIVGVGLLDGNGQVTNMINSDDAVTIFLDVKFNKDVCEPIFAFTIQTQNGTVVYNMTTRWMGFTTPNFSAGEKCRVEFKARLPLLEGYYELGVDTTPSDLTHFYDRIESALGFSVVNPNKAKGIVDLHADVAIKRA
jgi:ABC-type polysaccharide/polyol phosphate transport system ATPase subunit